MYTRKSALSKFNDIEVETDLPGTVGQLSSILMDVDQYRQWAYCTKSARLIKRISVNELVYYSEISAPWPLCNRDFYADILMAYDSTNHSACLVSNGLSHYLGEKRGLVRIPSSRGVWQIAQKSPGVIHVQYILQVDPGGSLPTWIANLFATKGPLETFTNLKKKMEALNGG